MIMRFKRDKFRLPIVYILFNEKSCRNKRLINHSSFQNHSAENVHCDFLLDRAGLVCYNTLASLIRAAILARGKDSGPKVQKEVHRNGIKKV